MIDYERLAALFRQVDTTAVADCDKSTRTLRGPIVLRSAAAWICAPAFPVRVRGDFFGVARAVEAAPPGQVIVVDAGGEELAVAGELFARGALSRSLAGLIVDGGVRDLAFLRTCPLPVYSRHVSPMAGTTRQLGELGVPVECGGVTVAPGDVVLADQEGVLVLDPSTAVDLVDAARTVKADESRAIRVLDGGGTLSDCLSISEHETALVAGTASTLRFRN